MPVRCLVSPWVENEGVNRITTWCCLRFLNLPSCTFYEELKSSTGKGDINDLGQVLKHCPGEETSVPGPGLLTGFTLMSALLHGDDPVAQVGGETPNVPQLCVSLAVETDYTVCFRGVGCLLCVRGP